jgi:hypothetical protein
MLLSSDCVCSGEPGFRPGPEGFAPGERLVLAAIRAWPKLDGACRSAQAAIRDGVTEAAGPLAAALLVQMLEGLAGREVERRCLCEHSLTSDEHRLVLACGLAGLFPDAAERVLAPVVGGEAARLVGLARPLTVELERAGLPLPVRLTALDGRPRTPQMGGEGARLDRPYGLLPSHRT